jgi:F0F1-type ATP synthase assembly protein I
MRDQGRKAGHEPAVKPKRVDISPFAAAIQWTSRITSIALEMTLPAFLGFWLDRQLGTVFVFLVVGAVAGFITAMLSLVRLGRRKPPDERME